MIRWLRFNLVGLGGFAVQILALLLTANLLGLHYLVATAIAVEAAVLHNFTWHERWTWRDRALSRGAGTRLFRFLAFNFTNGAVSLVGNLILMKLLVGVAGVGLLPGNLASVLVCSLVNFALSDRLVFNAESQRVSALLRQRRSPPILHPEGGQAECVSCQSK